VATTGHFASEVTARRLRRINRWMAGALRSFSILQPSAALVDELNRYQPSIVVTYPTAAVLLADEFERGRLRSAPKEVWTGGETLTPAVRQRLVRTFGCTVSNSYGASEFLPMGWECAHGSMHANSDWLVMEPVDEQHCPVPAGELSHTTLITHLGNELQPIIRYDLGDQVVMHPGRCRCGSPFPVIEVQGRQDDPLHMCGDEGQRVTLLPLALTTVLEDEAQVFDFQLLQRDERTLVLRLPVAGDAAAPLIARCRERLQVFARRQRLAPIELVAEPGAAFVRGCSGKVHRVIAAPPQALRPGRPAVHEALPEAAPHSA